MFRTPAAKFKQIVTIEKNTPKKAASGEETPSWANWAQPWAKIEPLTGRRWFEAQQFQTEVTYIIRMRYDSSLSAIDADYYRVTYNSVTYQIHAVLNKDLENKEFWLMCSVING